MQAIKLQALSVNQTISLALSSEKYKFIHLSRWLEAREADETKTQGICH
jgi:hypothetical protein